MKMAVLGSDRRTVFSRDVRTEGGAGLAPGKTGPTKSRLEPSGRRRDSGTVQTPSGTVRLQSGAVWTRIRVVYHATECRSTVLLAVGLLTAFRVTKVM